MLPEHRRFCRIATSVGLSLTVLASSGLMSAGAENVACDVQIVHPKNGTNVGQSEQADGKAQKPAGTFLWLLAHRKGFAPWWPQGAGPTVPDPQTGTWSTLVFFGVPRDVNNEFEVAAIVVDKAGNDLLVKWVEDTNKSQVYVPIAMPNPVTGCTPQLVTVRKTN